MFFLHDDSGMMKKFGSTLVMLLIVTSQTEAARMTHAQQEDFAATLYPGQNIKVRPVKTVTEDWRINGDEVVLL